MNALQGNDASSNARPPDRVVFWVPRHTSPQISGDDLHIPSPVAAGCRADQVTIGHSPVQEVRQPCHLLGEVVLKPSPMWDLEDAKWAAEHQFVGVGHERAVRGRLALDGACEPQNEPRRPTGSARERETTPTFQLEVNARSVSGVDMPLVLHSASPKARPKKNPSAASNASSPRSSTAPSEPTSPSPQPALDTYRNVPG